MDADVRSQLLEEASEYLKVEEDDVVFNLAFDAACETVAAAVGKFDENSARMKLALFLIMQQLYDNRSINLSRVPRPYFNMGVGECVLTDTLTFPLIPNILFYCVQTVFTNR